MQQSLPINPSALNSSMDSMFKAIMDAAVLTHAISHLPGLQGPLLLLLLIPRWQSRNATASIDFVSDRSKSI